jgi:hypothetical protein
MSDATTAALPREMQADREVILRKFFALGYFAGKEWDEVRTFVLGSKPVTDAVEAFRVYHELPAGSAIDDDVVANLMLPRCGLPDFVRSPEAAGVCKWPMLKVTTAQRISGLNPLAAEVELRCWRQALANWNAVCGLELSLIDAFEMANIYAQVGNTEAGVLAYSYLPCGATPKTRLQQVYNRATNWSEKLLLQVITHELGHAIGLDHGPQGALMQPTASGTILKPQAWDINQVQSRYGRPKPKPTPDPDPVPTPEGTTLTIGGDLAAGTYRLVPTNQASAWDMSPG